MSNDATPTDGIDIAALIAQIDAGVASGDTIVGVIGELLRDGKPVPLAIEAAGLRLYIAADSTRMDLKRRLITVTRMMGRAVDAELLSDVKASILEQEYETDFQSMLNEYSNKVRFADMEAEFLELVPKVRRFTMTTMERLYALWSMVGYLCEANITGDIVECGVWRGGSMMLVALELARRTTTDRHLWLYDTYAGLPRPNESIDVDILGNRAIDGWHAHTLTDGQTYWAYADEADVRANLGAIAYPADRLHFVKGLVEMTIPNKAPDQIALLRIDTDWYASYQHIQRELYDRVVPGGIVIFDDYGHYAGAKKAVDEFRAERNIKIPLIRVDYSCRMMIKPSAGA